MKFNLKKLKGVFTKTKRTEKAYAFNYEHNYHKLSFSELEKTFNTSLDNGLKDTVAKQLLFKNGKNKIKQKKPNLVLKILGYFLSGFCGVMWLGAIIIILAWKPIGN